MTATTLTYDDCLALTYKMEECALELGRARSLEVELADDRVAIKLDAIRRIMANGPNEFSGKAHSYSSAEAIVELDEEYRLHRAKQSSNLLAQELWRGRLIAARLRAELAVAMVGAPNGAGGAP